MSCIAFVVLTATVATSADARTRRERKGGAFQVALQPFSLVRQAVHAGADPIVENAPRAVARVVTAPVRIAATTSRMLPRDSERTEDSEDQTDEPVYTPEAIRAAQPVRAAARASYGEPIRVAYVTAQPVRRAEPAPNASWADENEEFDGSTPRDEQSNDSDGDEEDSEPTPQTHDGDRPTVAGSRAVLRNGIAYATSRAPENVKNAIGL